MKGFVYYNTLEMDSLRKVIADYFKDQETFLINKELHNYELKTNSLSDISTIGSIFSEKGEIRWKQTDAEKFSILLICESELINNFANFIKIGGDWDAINEDFYLISLNARQISPKFKDYPKNANALNISIYYRNNIATFVSPRRYKII